MLEHVTANQTRFVAPGLAPDPRRVALGRACTVLLPSLDRVVGLFRALSERTHLDDLLPSLSINQVKTPLQSQEFIVQLPVQSSFMADGVAQVAALMGGLTFTGSSKHFVKYRDSRSPLGYDVDSLHSGAGDYILYAEDFVQAYTLVRQLPFRRLVLDLSLERQRQDSLGPEEEALVRVVPGLWRMVVGYLHRNNRPCQVAACETEGGSGFEPRRTYLLRCRMEPRMVALFRGTPGVEVLRLKTDRAAVELGYRHPVELSSCTSIFEPERFFLFSGQRDRLDIISGEPAFVDAGAVVGLGQPGRELDTGELTPGELAGEVEIPLRLVTSQGPRQAVRAARIPLDQVRWLKKLVYLLPPQVLEQTRLCVAERMVYLLGDRGLEYIPLGLPFYQAAPDVMVAMGHELLPRVHPDVLLQHLGASGGSLDQVVLFSPGEAAPLRIPKQAFAPLSRQAVARVETRSPGLEEPPEPAPPPEPSLRNDPLGRFPLWGFRGFGADAGEDDEGLDGG